MIKRMLHTKCIALATLLSLVGYSSYGQGSYVKLDVGYGLQMTGTYGVEKELYSQDFSSFEYKKSSYGAGFNFGGTFGYMFNKNIGLEMGLSYLMGATQKAEFVFISRFGNSTTKYEAQGNMLRMMPSITFTPGYQVLNPYVRFGMIVGMGSMMVSLEEFEDDDLYLVKLKYNGGISLGHLSSLGATLKTGENAGVFFELNVINMNFSPSKSELIEASINGKSELHEYTTSEKETRFVSSYESSVGNNSSSEPAKAPKFSLPFGSINLNIGFKYAF